MRRGLQTGPDERTAIRRHLDNRNQVSFQLFIWVDDLGVRWFDNQNSVMKYFLCDTVPLLHTALVGSSSSIESTLGGETLGVRT